MSELKFDEILDECLRMLQAGASINDCVAPYPQHAEELRDRLEMAQGLIGARPEVQLEQSAQLRNRTRLLDAVAARQQEAGSAAPMLGLAAPLIWLFDSLRQPMLLSRALPVTLVLLVLTGTTIGALAATDAGGVRSIVVDAIRPGQSSDDDDVEEDDLGAGPAGPGGDGTADGLGTPGDDPDAPGAAATQEATATPTNLPDAPLSPNAPPTQGPATPANAAATPTDAPRTPANPTDTPANAPGTPANPTETPTDAPGTPANPTETPTDAPGTPANPAETPVNPPDTPTNPSGPSGTPEPTDSPQA